MARRIERDEKFYRIREGKEVEIPPEWVGNTVTGQSIRKRASKMTAKARKREKAYDRRKEDKMITQQS